MGAPGWKAKKLMAQKRPQSSATLRFDARASPNATVLGHAPPERVAPGDSPAHLALINPDAAPAVPQPIGASPYLHTTVNVSSTPLCKYMPGSSAGAGPACKCGGRARRGNRFWESLCSNCICFGCCAGLFLYMCVCVYIDINLKKNNCTASFPRKLVCSRCFEISAEIMPGRASKNPGLWLPRTLSPKSAPHPGPEPSRRPAASAPELKPGILEEPVRLPGMGNPPDYHSGRRAGQRQRSHALRRRPVGCFEVLNLDRAG